MQSLLRVLKAFESVEAIEMRKAFGTLSAVIGGGCAPEQCGGRAETNSSYCVWSRLMTSRRHKIACALMIGGGRAACEKPMHVESTGEPTLSGDVLGARGSLWNATCQGDGGWEAGLAVCWVNGTSVGAAVIGCV